MAAVSCPEIQSAAYRIVAGACQVLAESRLAAILAPAFRVAAVLVGLVAGALAAAAAADSVAGLMVVLELVVVAEAGIPVGAARGRSLCWRFQSQHPWLRHRDLRSGYRLQPSPGLPLLQFRTPAGVRRWLFGMPGPL